MTSRLNNKKCPICFEGTLIDGIKTKELEYRGHAYHYETEGAFCNHCQDGFPVHNDQEEVEWQKFRDKVDIELSHQDDVLDSKEEYTEQLLASLQRVNQLGSAELAEHRSCERDEDFLLTSEALADVDAGRVVNHSEVQHWVTILAQGEEDIGAGRHSDQEEVFDRIKARVDAVRKAQEK